MKNGLLSLFVVALLSACSREETQTYQTPKMQAPEAVAPMAQPATPPPAGNGFTATLPEGWTEKPGAGMRKISYSIEGTSIDFYLISLMMGDVPSNVNRWRGQVGLPEATPGEIASDLQTFQAAGHNVNYIEIYNPEGGTGIVAAIIDLSPQFWYFTAKGSVEELKTHAADIRAFLESIQFEGHNH